MLILQRRLFGDSGRWRSVVPFKGDDTGTVYQAVDALMKVARMDVQWRLVRGTLEQEPVAVYVNGRWVDPVGSDSPWWDSPHRQDSEWVPGDFEPTIPMGTR
jgi:hypothetical protein